MKLDLKWNTRMIFKRIKNGRSGQQRNKQHRMNDIKWMKKRVFRIIVWSIRTRGQVSSHDVPALVCGSSSHTSTYHDCYMVLAIPWQSLYGRTQPFRTRVYPWSNWCTRERFRGFRFVYFPFHSNPTSRTARRRTCPPSFPCSSFHRRYSSWKVALSLSIDSLFYFLSNCF